MYTYIIWKNQASANTSLAYLNTLIYDAKIWEDFRTTRNFILLVSRNTHFLDESGRYECTQSLMTVGIRIFLYEWHLEDIA